MTALPLNPSSELVAAVHEASDADDADAIYLGMGVATRSSMATGDLPLDALAMVLLAERERLARGASSIVHLIADTHALVNSFAERAAVSRAAHALRQHVERAARVLSIGEYHVVQASEIDDRLHREVHAAAGERTDDRYAARQAADVEWARRRLGASVKIGWTMNPNLAEAPMGYDERYFDGIYREIFGDKVTCVYGHPGRRIDSQRPRTSPYANEPGEQRLTMTGQAFGVAEACASKSMRRHLRPLVRELRSTLGLAADDDLECGLADVLAAFAAPEIHDNQKDHSHAA